MKRFIKTGPLVSVGIPPWCNNSETIFEFLNKSSSKSQTMYNTPYCISHAYFSTKTPLLFQSWAARKNRVWMCVKEECRHINASNIPNCELCNADKPSLKGWLCVDCGSRNHSGVKKCHKCSSDIENSNEFWMCIACEKNNRIDDLDDNSRCGFCGYDMAPMTMTESEALRIQNERSMRFREVQEQFDSISAKDAENQFGDETAGSSILPDDIKQTSSVLPPVKLSLKIPEVKPFTPTPIETAHSRIYRISKPSLPIGIPPGPPGFDWMCREVSCGTINPGDEENCSKCGTHITPVEWECCHCAALNHMSRSKCFNCRVTIPISWVCSSCQTATSIYDRECRQCGVARPATEPKEARDVHSSMNYAANTNSGVGGGFKKRMNNAQDWYCADCQGLNFASRTACFKCGTAKPASSENDINNSSSSLNNNSNNAGMEFAISHNNWFCRYCQASNFRTRASCWQCGRESAESGATAWSTEDSTTPHFEKEGFQTSNNNSETPEKVAEGQVSVWDKKTEDWTCGKCFSKNFKNRQECHKCGAAKKVAVAPRRAFVRKPIKI